MKKELVSAFSARQHMISKDFEIYYYSDQDLKKVESHRHNYFEIYFFLSGAVDMHINGKKYSLKNGDVVVIPPDTPHFATIRAEGEPYRRFIFWVTPEYLEELRILSPDYVYFVDLVSRVGEYVHHYDEYGFSALQAKVSDLIEEVGADRFGKAAKVTLCVNALILHLSRTFFEARHAKKPVKDEDLFGAVVQYIEAHIEEDLSLDLLAEKFFVSKFHVAHIFKEHMGVSTHQYILKKRLSMCRDAIVAGRPIGEACLMYGFSDYSGFYRAFQKEYGMSPKKYRDVFLERAGWMKPAES